MTLCVAWIRHRKEEQELVVATDSRLRVGEAWDSGIKLFDLGRRDCLLCFAGATHRAYPIILQSGNIARFKVEWSDPRLDVTEVLEGLCRLFTDLCSTISDYEDQTPDVHALRSEARFLFGGWSWRTQAFGIWEIAYNRELERFMPEAKHTEETTRIFSFLGDLDEASGLDLAEDANRLLQADLEESGKLLRGSALDMEPLLILTRMSRDMKEYTTVGGALQVAKVYPSGNNEFFGVLWKSSVNGTPHFLGRPVDPLDAPPVRLIDPDTAELVERLPAALGTLTPESFGREAEFIRKCYPAGVLDLDLPDVFRDRLQRLFRDRAYAEFVDQLDTGEAGAGDEAGLEDALDDHEPTDGDDAEAAAEDDAPDEPTDLEEAHHDEQ